MNTQEQAAFDLMREALEQVNCILDGSPATAKYVSERTPVGASTYDALAAAKEVSAECSKVTSEYSEQPKVSMMTTFQLGKATQPQAQGEL